MYTNADSLRNKRDELKIRLNSKSMDEEISRIGITEVCNISGWNTRNIEHFDLISNNIENNEGRGVALYIKKPFEATPVEFLVKFCEDIWAAIKLQGGEKSIAGCIL